MSTASPAPLSRFAQRAQAPQPIQSIQPISNAGRTNYPASMCFDGALQLFNHGHIQTAFHARLFKTGELCIPGHPPEYVSIRFLNFQFNAMQDRFDAVYSVLRNGQSAGEFFASAFRHLWL